jgi:hypothetical protein
MKTIHSLSFALITTLFTLGGACAAPAADGLDNGEGAQSTVTVDDEPSSEARRLSGRCSPGLQNCNQCGPSSCGTPCCAIEREPGFEFRYEDDCRAWAKPNWVPKASQPKLICHLDMDKHWNEIDIEINAATAYEDTGCAHHPDRWSKQRVATVECSLWTSFTNKEKCERRVTEKITQLASQGYVPTVTDVDKDLCPTPRL